MQSLPEESELDDSTVTDYTSQLTLMRDQLVYDCDCAFHAINSNQHINTASKLRLLLRVIHSLKTNPKFDGYLPTLMMSNLPVLIFRQHDIPTVPQLVIPCCWTGNYRNNTMVLESSYSTGDNLLITVPIGQPVTYIRI
jgi:hypothetical protein